MRKSKSAIASPATALSDPAAAEPKENKPVHRIRYGSVKATIWGNDSPNGAFYTVTVTRSYRDEKNVWHDTGSFHFKDLPHLAKAITDSHSWIAWQERQIASQAKGKGGGS